MYVETKRTRAVVLIISVFLVIFAISMLVIMSTAESYRGPAEMTLYNPDSHNTLAPEKYGDPADFNFPDDGTGTSIDEGTEIIDDMPQPLAPLPIDLADGYGLEFAITTAVSLALIVIALYLFAGFFDERSRAISKSREIRNATELGNRKPK